MKLGELFANAKKKKQDTIDTEHQLGKEALHSKVKVKNKTSGGTKRVDRGANRGG